MFIFMVMFVLENIIIFGSFLKVFVMIGWCIGYMIVLDYINEVVKLINEGVMYFVFMLL